MILIIGGFPRSGTRSYADALNLTPGVDIRGEVHRAAIPPLSNWLQLNDGAHRKLGLKDEYVKHRWLTGLNAIVGTGRGGNAPFTMSNMLNNIVGFKCPSIEVRLKHLEKVFKPRFNPFEQKSKILFFFCSRRLDQVFLSRANMTSKKRGAELPIEGFIKETKSQLRALEKMTVSEVFEPHVLHLDSFTASDSKVAWLKEHIFDVLGVVVQDLSKYEEGMSVNNNSTKKVFGGKRESAIPDEVAKKLVSDPELNELCQSFKLSYSYDLLDF